MDHPKLHSLLLTTDEWSLLQELESLLCVRVPAPAEEVTNNVNRFLLR